MNWRPPYPEPSTPLQRAKLQLQRDYRPQILERDNHGCVACGAVHLLELAHITAVHEFYGAFGRSRSSLERSYRDDNLCMLCRDCHLVYDNNWKTLHQPLINAYIERKKLRSKPFLEPYERRRLAQLQVDIQRLRLEDPTKRRRERVVSKMEARKRARGWTEAQQIDHPEHRELTKRLDQERADRLARRQKQKDARYAAAAALMERLRGRAIPGAHSSVSFTRMDDAQEA